MLRLISVLGLCLWMGQSCVFSNECPESIVLTSGAYQFVSFGHPKLALERQPAPANSVLTFDAGANAFTLEFTEADGTQVVAAYRYVGQVGRIVTTPDAQSPD